MRFLDYARDDKQGLDSSTTLHYARNDSIDEILTTPLRSAQDDIIGQNDDMDEILTTTLHSAQDDSIDGSE